MDRLYFPVPTGTDRNHVQGVLRCPTPVVFYPVSASQSLPIESDIPVVP